MGSSKSCFLTFNKYYIITILQILKKYSASTPTQWVLEKSGLTVTEHNSVLMITKVRCLNPGKKKKKKNWISNADFRVKFTALGRLVYKNSIFLHLAKILTYLPQQNRFL